MSWCFTCGGNGLEGEACPDCGKRAGMMVLEEAPTTEVMKFLVKTEATQIPEFYEGNFWDFNKLVSSREGVGNPLFMKYAKGLQIMHDAFMLGNIPAKSVLVIAPSTYSKLTWAYSCMQYALKRGYTVAPLLDTMEVKRLLVVPATNTNYRLNGVSYDEYINSQVMFITVTRLDYHKEAYSIIEEIISRRSRIGLPTYFISRYSLEDLSDWDRTKNFSRMNRSKLDDNFKKFLSVIKYVEEYYTKGK